MLLTHLGLEGARDQGTHSVLGDWSTTGSHYETANARSAPTSLSAERYDWCADADLGAYP
jgi:hypothetical protein